MKIRDLGAAAIVCGLAGAAMAGPVVIDGTISSGEWAGSTVLTIGNGGGTAYVRADANYVYGAFDVTGWTSAMGAGSGGNLLGFGAWAADNSYGAGPGVEFQQATAEANWGGGGNSGTMNGLVSAFRLDTVIQGSIPGDLQAMDSFATGHRVWEVKMPISHLAKIAGDTVWIVGGINFAGQAHWYPDTFFTNGYSGYAGITVEANAIPLPSASALAGLGLLGLGARRRRVSL